VAQTAQHEIPLSPRVNLRSHEGVDDFLPRIVLADDQIELLQTVALLLVEDFDVVGAIDNGTAAVELSARLCPDVVVMDICMPTMSGIDAALRLREIGCAARIVFLTVHNDPDFVEAAFSAGASGYVLKQFLATDLIPAIWAALEGHAYVSPALQFQ